MMPAMGIMGLWRRLLGRGEAKVAALVPKPKRMNLAFVLLPEARLPRADAVVGAFASFSLNGEQIRERPEGEGAKPKPGDSEALVFDLGPDGMAMVGLIPTSVPKGEADRAARYSVSAFGGDPKLPPHEAHLIVVQNDTDVATVDALSRFTTMLAALVEASGAVGVYWGDAGATHDAKFFVDLARDEALVARLMLWTGVSVARGADGGVSLLSLGMEQLGLPDLLLSTQPTLPLPEALDFFFNMLAMVVERGSPLPEGDTVGRSDNERLPVRYVPSPADAGKKVWSVEVS
jgi:uncharacterized protein DUF4261